MARLPAGVDAEDAEVCSGDVRTSVISAARAVPANRASKPKMLLHLFMVYQAVWC
jgi:hypothetical protein